MFIQLLEYIVLNKKLPNLYQQVEYIGNTGTQYIDTGFKPNYIKGFTFEVKYQPTDTYSRGCFLSNWNENNNISYELRVGKERVWSAYGTERRANIDSDESYTLGVNVGSLKVTKNIIIQTVNGVSKTSSYTTEAKMCNKSVYMFIDYGFRFDTFVNYVKIYFCKIYDGDVLVRYFIPCYRKLDNEIGMYDTVNGVFYTNQGAGTFIKGQDI